jgi:hypothetical protein
MAKSTGAELNLRDIEDWKNCVVAEAGLFSDK